MTGDFVEKLTKIAGTSAVKLNEPMKEHTTFHIGGPADVFVTPKDVQTLIAAVEYCNAQNVPWMVIGRGSNLLVSDDGIRGVVFLLYHTLDHIEMETLADGRVKVCAGAGVLLSRLAKTVADEGLGGFEFAGGIPGTFGGAVTMNAGAYGGEMKSHIDTVKVLTRGGQVKLLKQAELEMGYRTSVIQKEGYVVLEGTLILNRGEKEAVYALMNDYNGRRRDKQPLEYPSAGSVFKRPEGYFAGKLIEDAGLKGHTIGGAQVSEKHSGFIINVGDATAQDVMTLIAYIQNVVQEKFGVLLEPEIRRIGG